MNPRAGLSASGALWVLWFEFELESMNRQVSHDVLRRMVSPPPRAPEDVPITSSRAMRLAVTRAADTTHRLALSVTQLREEVLDLDTMLAGIADDFMLVGMVDDTRTLLGLAAIDAGLRSALIEIQTIGKVLTGGVDDRPPTATDAKMAEPVLAAILHHLNETAERTPLDGWGQGLAPMGRVTDTRSAGLVLPEGDYRVLRLELDLRVEGRTGALIMALPDQAKRAVPLSDKEEQGDWDTLFQKAVNAAPVSLDAELHRFQSPLEAVQGFSVGDVIPLVGCDVTSVKLRARDGRKIATARLGQAGGKRAIRVEAAVAQDLSSLSSLGTSAAEAEDAGLMAISAMGENAGVLEDAADRGGTDGIDAWSEEVATEDPDLAISAPMNSVEDNASGVDQSLDWSAALEEGDEESASPSGWDAKAAEAAPLDWSSELGEDDTPSA